MFKSNRNSAKEVWLLEREDQLCVRQDYAKSYRVNFDLEVDSAIEFKENEISIRFIDSILRALSIIECDIAHNH